MVSPFISKTLSLCFFVYLTVTVCCAIQETARQHKRYIFPDLNERSIWSDYFEYEDTDYPSEILNDEASGDYDSEASKEETDDTGHKTTLGISPIDVLLMKNPTEILEKHGFIKTKFSNQVGPDGNDITIMPENDNSSTEPPANGNDITIMLEVDDLTREPAVQTMVTKTEQTHMVASTTSSPDITTETMPTRTSIAKETTRTTGASEDHNCRPNDCEEMEVAITPNYQSLLPGGNFTLLCNAATNVSELLQFNWWYLEDKNGRFKINNATDNKLVLEAKLSNGGKYMCVVVYEEGGCCESSATSVVVIYEKPAYWIHIVVLLGISLGLLLFVCVPFTVKLHRKYRYMETFKNHNAQDKQPLTI